MEKRALVVREPCATDHGGAFVVITLQGREVIEAAAPLHVADVRKVIIGHLTPAQLDLLSELGDQVRARLAGLEQESSVD